MRASLEICQAFSEEKIWRVNSAERLRRRSIPRNVDSGIVADQAQLLDLGLESAMAARSRES